MCGITGIFAFNLVGKFNLINITSATQALSKRGPDVMNIYNDEFVGLGHRRLSIIDTSDAGNQPMWDPTGRYAIVFNGEIFNYRELRKQLDERGITFQSQSDTEVLLHYYILEKEKCLSRLNGFFAFCIYDKAEQIFFIARDRYGIKPLLYTIDEDKFIFASEMKSILQYGIEKQLDYTSLYTYLQLNYIPAPDSIYANVKKLMPGHFAVLERSKLTTTSYYSIPFNRNSTSALSYENAKSRFVELLEQAVQRRLVADVPLGSFLSGGIDSSVIAGLAARHKPDLHTFSIGFRDEKFFDETHYATLVAKHFKTDHTVFSLTNNDLYAHVYSILDYLDEPFADSSAIAVNILSRETRKHATVALSGDGADELLAGYNKHAAFYCALHPGIKEQLVTSLHPLWRVLPKSRNTAITNRFRQFDRFANAMKLSAKDRYWRWAGFVSETDAWHLFSDQSQKAMQEQTYLQRKSALLQTIPDDYTINDVLVTDMHVVLPNDMLTKVDLMSMANSLEVRVPFLDVHVVNFIFSLPEEFKITTSLRKRILQDAFRDFLPPKLYNRPKKGFEVPLLKWFRSEMRSLIQDDLLSDAFVSEQGIFQTASIQKIKKQLFSSNPGDVHAQLWALIVFQWWWKKYHAK